MSHSDEPSLRFAPIIHITNRSIIFRFEGISVVRKKKKEIESELSEKLISEKEQELNRTLEPTEEAVIAQAVNGQLKNLDLSRACLKFQAFVVDELDNHLVEICAPVFSSEIVGISSRSCKKNLRLISMSPCSGSMCGGTDVIMLVEAVDEGSWNLFSSHNDAIGNQIFIQACLLNSLQIEMKLILIF